MPRIRVEFAPVVPVMLGLVLGGCSSRISVQSVEPGLVSLGAARHLTILQAEGHRKARETVILEITDQSRSRGFFTVEDRSEEGVEVRLAGRRAIVDGAEEFLAPGHVGMRVDVVKWNAHRDLKYVTRTNDEGDPFTISVRTLNGSAVLAVSIFDRSGRAFLAEREYEGAFETDDVDMPRDEVIESAARQAVNRLLADIMPRHVRTRVRLDDEGQRAILETGKAGNVAQAADDAKRYLERNPNRASAAYNLAVFLDAMGRYDEALDMYDWALTLGNKDYYVSARADCARRLAAVEGLAPADAPAAPTKW